MLLCCVCGQCLTASVCSGHVPLTLVVHQRKHYVLNTLAVNRALTPGSVVKDCVDGGYLFMVTEKAVFVMLVSRPLFIFFLWHVDGFIEMPFVCSLSTLYVCVFCAVAC